MAHGTHRASFRQRDPRRVRRAVISTAVIIVSIGAASTLAVAAEASPVSTAPLAAQYRVSAGTRAGTSGPAPPQTLTVSASVARSKVTLDVVHATSQKALDAKNAAKAAAAAAAAAATLAAAEAAEPHIDNIAQPLVPLTAFSGTIVPPSGADGQSVVNYALQFVGVVPYVVGGTTPATGFECDSFVDFVYAAFGVRLPRGVSAIADLGTEIPASDAAAGDLVVYPGQHIGIYDGHGGIIDAPKPGDYVSHRPVWGAPEYFRL